MVAVTAAETAQRLGVSVQAVYGLLKRGALVGERILVKGRARWAVDPASVERYASTRGVGSMVPAGLRPPDLWARAADRVAVIDAEPDDKRACVASALVAIAHAALADDDGERLPNARVAANALTCAAPLFPAAPERSSFSELAEIMRGE